MSVLVPFPIRNNGLAASMPLVHRPATSCRTVYISEVDSELQNFNILRSMPRTDSQVAISEERHILC